MSICNKITFSTKKEAKQYLKDKRQYKSPPAKIRPYLCNVCGQWHYTSKSKAEARRWRKIKRRKENEYKHHFLKGNNYV